MEQKAEIDNLLRQVSAFIETCRTITGDTVLTKAELIKEYKERKVEHWNLKEAIAAWEEIQALAATEVSEVEGVIEEVPPTIEDARIENAEIGQDDHQEEDNQQ
ncbi:hypothetical protein ACOSQ4_016866 [Xanthoceras sorbifolium]